MVYVRESTQDVPSSELRVRCYGDPEKNDEQALTWSIRHFGIPLEDSAESPIQTIAKPLVEVEVNENPRQLLEGMGYKMKFEVVLDGYRWHIVDSTRWHSVKQQQKQQLQQLQKQSQKDDKNSEQTNPTYPYYITIVLPIQVIRSSSFEIVKKKPLFDDAYVVEIFGYALDKDVVSLSSELNSFANKLLPAVNMMKLDGSNLQQLKKIIDSKSG